MLAQKVRWLQILIKALSILIFSCGKPSLDVIGRAAIHMGMKPPPPSAAGVQTGSGAASDGARQRYFRIPFVRPADENRDGEFQKKGLHNFLTPPIKQISITLSTKHWLTKR